MLQKVLKILGVGRLNQIAAAEVGKTTIVYADNGMGKTTLASIIRSAVSGDPRYLLERKTIGLTSTPQVELLTKIGSSSRLSTFNGTSWDHLVSDCEVFDTHFVSENVYAGSEVDSDQRKNLHNFVLGASNVTLAKRVEVLDKAIRETNQAIAAEKQKITELCTGGITLEEFLVLPECPEVEEAIRAQEKVVEATRAAATIFETDKFDTPIIPSWSPAAWDTVLVSSLRDVERDSEQRVHAQSARLGEDGEDWLSQGTQYIAQDRCPFCDQDVTASNLVKSYLIFFSQAYEDFKEAITTASDEVTNTTSEHALSALNSCFNHNESIGPFWKAHGVEVPESPPRDFLKNRFEELAAAYSSRFDVKLNDPLVALERTPEMEKATTEVGRIDMLLASYEQAVIAANSQIEDIRVALGGTTLEVELDKLRSLRHRKERFSESAIALAESLNELKNQKTLLEDEKAAARTELTRLTEELFSKYQDTINKHLANFGCGYRITKTKTAYAGGIPRADYKLAINDHDVALTGPKNDPLAPAFKNTLSDGDKSSLAFAFFLSRLEVDPALSSKIVVLDDPITSLDANRRAYTCQQLANLAPKVKQLIVMTHDASFARQLWDCNIRPITSLQIKNSSGQSSIIQWDVLEATQSDYFARYDLVKQFVMGGSNVNTRSVATALRPLLEGNLRVRFPDSFASSEWLGGFVGKIRDCSSSDPLSKMKPHYDNLASLNDYSKNFHHDQNPNAASVPIVEAELRAFATRTLDFIAGTN